MSYELVKQWINDSSSVPLESIENAYEEMYTKKPTYINILIISCLLSIIDAEEGHRQNVLDLIAQYESRI
jgi:hypothetical protein